MECSFPGSVFAVSLICYTNRMDKESTVESELARLNKLLNKLYASQSYMNSFVHGVLSGLGSVIGATIVVAGLVSILGQAKVIPVIGDWIAAVAVSVKDSLPKK
jgi:hypothetical protein